MSKCLSILSFIYLFVSLFAHATNRAYRVHVFKKKQTKKKKKKQEVHGPQRSPELTAVS